MTDTEIKARALAALQGIKLHVSERPGDKHPLFIQILRPGYMFEPGCFTWEQVVKSLSEPPDERIRVR